MLDTFREKLETIDIVPRAEQSEIQKVCTGIIVRTVMIFGYVWTRKTKKCLCYYISLVVVIVLLHTDFT
jgi:hypothetical protein